MVLNDGGVNFAHRLSAHYGPRRGPTWFQPHSFIFPLCMDFFMMKMLLTHVTLRSPLGPKIKFRPKFLNFTISSKKILHFVPNRSNCPMCIFMPETCYQKMSQIGREMTELRRFFSEIFRRNCGVRKIHKESEGSQTFLRANLMCILHEFKVFGLVSTFLGS